MNPLLKNALLAIVLGVLVTLAGALTLPVLLTPGFLIVRVFVHLPEPYVVNHPDAPYSTAVLLSNLLFWILLFTTWAFIGYGRKRRVSKI